MEHNSTQILTDELTICTVSYHSASLLDLNLSLTRELNPAANYRWIVVDNDNDFQVDEPHPFQLLKGDPCSNQGRVRGSYHHAQSLNKALEHVATRFVLVLDPDFFIIRENWIQDVLAHLASKDISLWGAPYYPHASWKRRYVPAAYCMLIDLEKIEKDKLDFTPELDEYLALFESSTMDLLGILFGRIPAQLGHMKQSILQDVTRVVLRNRFIAAPLSAWFPKRFYPNTNVSRDTGFKIQNEYGASREHIVETLKPSYRSDLFTKKKSFWMNLFAQGYYWLVPENLSIYPKRRDYSMLMSFKDFGLFDVRSEFGWEEYFWSDKPFAMHIKSGTKRFEDIGYNALKEILFHPVGKPVSIKSPVEAVI